MKGPGNSGKMPRRSSARPMETSGKGKSARNPHPNGGETRACSVNVGRMPKQVTTASIRHTDLDVGSGSAGLGQMPKQVNRPGQRDPRRR